jgi:hypothetical protein
MNEFLSPERMALMIPIISVVAVALIITTAVTLRFVRRRRLFELYHEERMAAIAKGVDVPALPEALLSDGSRVRTPGAVLLRGLIWLFIGIPLFFAIHETNPRGATFALIPVGVGMAYLFYYFLEGRKAQSPPSEPPAPQPPLSSMADAKV